MDLVTINGLRRLRRLLTNGLRHLRHLLTLY